MVTRSQRSSAAPLFWASVGQSAVVRWWYGGGTVVVRWYGDADGGTVVFRVYIYSRRCALIHALASAQNAATTVTMTVTMPVDDSDDSDGDDHSDPEGRHLP